MEIITNLFHILPLISLFGIEISQDLIWWFIIGTILSLYIEYSGTNTFRPIRIIGRVMLAISVLVGIIFIGVSILGMMYQFLLAIPDIILGMFSLVVFGFVLYVAILVIKKIGNLF